MRTSKRLQTAAVASVAALAFGITACENGTTDTPDTEVDPAPGVEEPADPGADDGLDTDPADGADDGAVGGS